MTIDSFEKVVDEVMAREEFKNLHEYKKKGRRFYNPQNTQYSAEYGEENSVFWYKFLFNENGKEKLKEEYSEVIGFHIMPFRIKKDDVKKAELSDKDKRPFNKWVIEHPEYVDLDMGTGNFHKKPDGQYQIVLITCGGPGLRLNADVNEKEGIITIAEVKTDYYFPPVGGKNEEADVDLGSMLNEALSTVLKDWPVNRQKAEK